MKSRARQSPPAPEVLVAKTPAPGQATRKSATATDQTPKPPVPLLDAAKASAEKAPRTRSKPGATRTAPPVDDFALRMLGVASGELVRFRRQQAGRWTTGIIVRRERDGSVGLTDTKGAARAIPIERIEVCCIGPRGGRAWEPLVDRASRSEQLRLL